MLRYLTMRERRRLVNLDGEEGGRRRRFSLRRCDAKKALLRQQRKGRSAEDKIVASRGQQGPARAIGVFHRQSFPRAKRT